MVLLFVCCGFVCLRVGLVLDGVAVLMLFAGVSAGFIAVLGVCLLLGWVCGVLILML